MSASARLFATKGYTETTMRDIGAEIDMLPGSVYYHFKSKQELLLAVYEQAVSGIKSRLEKVIEDEDDPWIRLEKGVINHIETILDESDFARVMIGVLPDKAPEVAGELARLRNGYEQKFIEIIDELPLKSSVDPRLVRLMLLGAVNASQGWFQRGKFTPEDIAREYVHYLKEGINQ